MLRAAEFFLLGRFGGPTSDKTVTLPHLEVVGPWGKSTLVLSEVPRQGPIVLTVCFTSFRKWAVLS